MSQHFTLTELRTLRNKNFFYIKTSATQKIDALFADVRDKLKSEIKKEKLFFPSEVDITMGKIFRGENYLGLPYLVLDYPKHFSKESVFTFRSMFWWGNFFSFTLHLQGRALEERRNILIQNWRNFKKKNIYICVNKNPWQYHYKKENYVSVDKFPESGLKHLFITKEFIKLSRKISLKDYKRMGKFARESFIYLYPGDKF